MRPPRGGSSHGSATPIYDSLYAEYRRLFRALPGDRTGEEDLRFVGFGVGHGGPAHPMDDHLSVVGSWQIPAWHVPALPPAPRDGHGRH
ncbi:hypothetical protein DEH18_10485 [Streptomyces sp. NHF165]|nr:hypothetical protein [Streptomyces cacaoi]QHF98431.1 hypothetical protein DEH18_10485 [Streptomyces sp. NHF165]